MAATYRIETQPIALQDLTDAVTYIAHELKSPAAADKLAEEVIAGIETLAQLPYRCPPYITTRPLRREYRKLQVGSYLVFFTVSEEDEVVTVARVLYAGRDLSRQLT